MLDVPPHQLQIQSNFGMPVAGYVCADSVGDEVRLGGAGGGGVWGPGAGLLPVVLLLLAVVVVVMAVAVAAVAAAWRRGAAVAVCSCVGSDSHYAVHALRCAVFVLSAVSLFRSIWQSHTRVGLPHPAS